MVKSKLLVILLAMQIIAILLVLPLLSAIGTDEDLKYQVQSSGSCKITVYDTSGASHLQDIVVTVRTADNWIYKKFDGSPGLPLTSTLDLSNAGINACSSFGLNYNNLNFWDLAREGIIEERVAFCEDGNIVDPSPLNGIAEYKCSDYCVPEKQVCISNFDLAKCSSDGNEISHDY
jgi:hypothetical protein